MDNNFFKSLRILDGGMGQELLARGLVHYGTLWSTSALIDENYHKLVIDTHSAFINAGADVIVTNNFSARKVRLDQNNVGHLFDYINKKAGELAVIARDNSKKDILIAGGLPPQDATYVADNRDKKIIEKSFSQQAKLMNPYVDFFYLDVFSSSWEIELALNVIERLNKPVLVGVHLKENGKLDSNETMGEIVKKYKSKNWLGLIASCVSLEITEKSMEEMKRLKLPFGCKANLWKKNPLPVNKLENADPHEIGINPNKTLGSRKEITDKVFYDFAKRLKKHGATILGGCCETNISHISALSRLK